jgi:hypothetical protein
MVRQEKAEVRVYDEIQGGFAIGDALKLVRACAQLLIESQVPKFHFPPPFSAELFQFVFSTKPGVERPKSSFRLLNSWLSMQRRKRDLPAGIASWTAATTAAAESAASTTPAFASTLRLWPGFIDVQGAAFEAVAIEGRNRSISLRRVVHFHESESA